MTDEKGIVEAALFSAGHPIPVEEIAQTTAFEPARVKELLKELEADYTNHGSAIEVASVGGKWTMQIRMDYSARAQAFAPPEVPRDLLKTMALIAYHQPLLQSELADMIGSKVYEHVQQLEGINLISKKPSGRSFELTTTRYFAEFFGLRETSREGIRRILAEKAGVKFTPKAEPRPEPRVTAQEPVAETTPEKGPTPQEASPSKSAEAITGK